MIELRMEPNHRITRLERTGRAVVEYVGEWTFGDSITRVGRVSLVVVILVTLLAQPVAAQTDTTNPVCEDSSGTLQDMISGFLQITVGIGVMGLLIVWQLDELLNMFTTNPEQKRRLKQHRTGAARSAFVLVALGPLAKVAGTIMGLPLASCVDLVPF